MYFFTNRILELSHTFLQYMTTPYPLITSYTFLAIRFRPPHKRPLQPIRQLSQLTAEIILLRLIFEAKGILFQYA